MDLTIKDYVQPDHNLPDHNLHTFLSLPDKLRSAAIQSALSKLFLFVVGQSAKPSGLIA